MNIITYGTFDLFHIGHLNLLRRARKFGGHLTVGISTDEFNLKSKFKRCEQLYYERSEIVNSVKYVDEIIPEISWEQKVKDIRGRHIDIFIIGDDWTGKFDFLKDLCEVIYIPRTQGISTTDRKINIFNSVSNV